MSVPERPALSAHVFARRHVVDGKDLVVLHDTENLVSHRLGQRAWTVAAAMDGTRDVVGIVERCRQEGVVATEDEVRAFVAELWSTGLVGEGDAPRKADPDAPAEAEPAPARDLPLVHLPGFALHCDGSGSCCRFYPTIACSQLDAARARARLPLVRAAGEHLERGFTPMRGNDARMLAVTLVDGRCAYLDGEDRCGVHAAGSAEEKPLGCRVYPARFVDDGESVRVSPWVECACVLASAEAGGPAGDPLVPTTSRRRTDLDPAIYVERLPGVISVGRDSSADPRAVSAWSLAVVDTPVVDGCASLLALAAVLDGQGGLDVEAAKHALAEPPAPPLDELRQFLEALAPRAQRLADEPWRSPNDLARKTATAIAAACALAGQALDELAAPAPRYRSDEAFYVRATLFGHHLVHPRRTMATVARDRALRVLLARSFAVVVALTEQKDAAFARPLALIEATMRAYGLSAYVRDVGRPSQSLEK